MNELDYLSKMKPNFGRRLRLVRVARGMSQIELRDRMERECGVNIGQTYISELERSNRKSPTLPVAAAMAKVLGVSLDYLGLISDHPITCESDSDLIPA